jgi:DNA-binding IclR family transcriptional regulator
MPRKPAQPSLADTDAAPGGAAAVDRALTLLAAFRSGDAALGLAELAARTGLYKSTALRLLASLEHARFVQRRGSEGWVPGPELARLGALHADSFSLQAVVQPALRELVATTGESAAFHVRQGDERLCLFRQDSPQLLRDHIRAGDRLPLNRGSGGRVLMAYAGARGRLYDQIRRDGVIELVGDRVPDLVGISAPVFGADATLAGALTLTLPASRRRPALAGQVQAAAAGLSRALGAPVR